MRSLRNGGRRVAFLALLGVRSLLVRAESVAAAPAGLSPPARVWIARASGALMLVFAVVLATRLA